MPASAPCSRVTASLPCAVCGGSEATVVATHGRDGQPLRSVACTGCGLVWSDPRPHDVRRFYAHDYRRDYKHTDTPRPKHVVRAGRVALDRWRRVQDLLRPGARVLDVGSGGGEFAHLLARLGHRVTGVEPNVGYAEHAARSYGLDVRRGFLDEVELPPASMDLVTIWHVLEHTEQPGATLARLHDLLAPGGRLVVEVPSIEATCQSPRSTFHAAHLVHFNVATLRALAAQAGLREVRHGLSADGGNLTMVFAAGDAKAVPAPLPGNHARVAGVLEAHRPWRHALRTATAWRSLRRLGGAVGEQWTLLRLRLRGDSARSLLDRYYDLVLDDAPAAPVPAWRFPALAALALGWAWWLECELVDDAAALGWSTAQGTLAYLGVQLALLAGVAMLARQVGGSRTRLGGLAVLLAAMPALH